MPRHPDDDNREPAGNFFQRWSQRKAEAASLPGEQELPATSLDAGNTPEHAARTVSEPDAATHQVTEADLENLSYESDYTKFMGEHVPEALRRRALRQLWRSDPILANVDGLCDYDDDYTDAALAVKVLKTAHRVGQGYLTDEEVAANQARGKPKSKPVADAETDAEELDDIEVAAADGDPETPTVTAEAVDDQADQFIDSSNEPPGTSLSPEKTAKS